MKDDLPFFEEIFFSAKINPAHPVFNFLFLIILFNLTIYHSRRSLPANLCDYQAFFKTYSGQS